jgi:hypothetical protein
MNSPSISVPDHPSIFVIKGAKSIQNSIATNWTVLTGLQKALTFTQARIVTVSLLVGENRNNHAVGGTGFAIGVGDQMVGRQSYSLNNSNAWTSVFIEETFKVEPGTYTIQAYWKPSTSISFIGENAAPTMKIHVHEIGIVLY